MYYKCDIKYIFHAFIVFMHWIQSAHFIRFGYKSHLLKMPYIPNKWERQQTKQRIQSTCILLYNILYYSSTLFHEIITKSFARPTVIILCRL